MTLAYERIRKWSSWLSRRCMNWWPNSCYRVTSNSCYSTHDDDLKTQTQNFMKSLRHCVLSHHFSMFMFAKLAEISLCLEELRVMVLAVESAFVGNIIWWADHTASMGTFETRPVVWGAVNCHLSFENYRTKLFLSCSPPKKVPDS